MKTRDYSRSIFWINENLRDSSILIIVWPLHERERVWEKSALLAKLAFDLRSKKGSPVVISTTGADLYGLIDIDSKNPLMLVNQWQQAICTRLSLELGRGISLALSDRDMHLVEASELTGFKDRNLIGSLLSRLRPKIKAEGIEIDLAPSSASPNLVQLLRRKGEAGEVSAWLLIDDIDSTFQDTQNSRARVSAFFSACRKIAREIPGVYIRASVRSDVWTSIRDNEDLDKCEQYMTDISWSRKEVGVMVTKKILTWVRRESPGRPEAQWTPERDASSIMGLAFQPRLSWGKRTRSPAYVLNVLASGRPRWATQLCRMSGLEAYRTRNHRISKPCIDAVMPRFGKSRLADLVKEHGHQFSDIRGLTECFAQGKRRYSTSDLLDRIYFAYTSRRDTGKVPMLNGVQVSSALDLAHFLYKIGFIHGRGDEQHDFVGYDERPDLLLTEENLDDGLPWEVTPAYRRALRIR